MVRGKVQDQAEAGKQTIWVWVQISRQKIRTRHGPVCKQFWFGVQILGKGEDQTEVGKQIIWGLVWRRESAVGGGIKCEKILATAKSHAGVCQNLRHAVLKKIVPVSHPRDVCVSHMCEMTTEICSRRECTFDR